MAETIVCAGLKDLRLERGALADLPKNAPAKALLAHIITEQTSVPQKWIAQTLHMGSAPYVSKLAKEMKVKRGNNWNANEKGLGKCNKSLPDTVFACNFFALSINSGNVHSSE